MLYVEMSYKYKVGVTVDVKFAAEDMDAATKYIDTIKKDEEVEGIVKLHIDQTEDGVIILPEDYEL